MAANLSDSVVRVTPITYRSLTLRPVIIIINRTVHKLHIISPSTHKLRAAYRFPFI